MLQAWRSKQKCKKSKENALFAPESDRSNLGNGVGWEREDGKKNETKLVSMGGFVFSNG